MVERTHAWQFNGAGNALQLDYKALPLLEAGQILVRNLAIGINPVDWKFIDADPISWPKGHTPGVDGAGEVLAVGAGVDAQLVGQIVAYHHSLSLDGSFAEHTVLFANRVMRIPQSLSPSVAAALPCPMLTAWQAFSKIPAVKGAKVLITGMGAVNKLLAQMLSHSGFKVHVLSQSLTQEQADKLSIDAVFRQAPSAGGYFALFDANGPDTARELVPLLQANGHVISILGRIDNPVDAPFTRTISYHEIALGALHDYGDSAQWQRLVRDGERLLEDVVAGHLQVEQPSEFAFDALNDALIFSKEEKQKAVVLNQ
ncbi:alcohol dehydrogenase catalytic domain-containing protein [Pseudoalteromonas ruthenica]|uniref:alcohol dehydrogenase catalytic domain-containing protein n=1 Tax=Pseudoalteromonas ruthenica TaxID=151081 RepID=UPI00110BD7A9|nr:alcohol dehydrogenase catalytic domain-containing protein [Pseudoalteromonas ruthenica]TMO48371.1 alcohol dehydrogenase [Pseudoalteromonas ruthenica]TMO48744.1 alcohol dehydrogenase [Pseudoalteromonas ruthenica]